MIVPECEMLPVIGEVENMTFRQNSMFLLSMYYCVHCNCCHFVCVLEFEIYRLLFKMNQDS